MILSVEESRDNAVPTMTSSSGQDDANMCRTQPGRDRERSAPYACKTREAARMTVGSPPRRLPRNNTEQVDQLGCGLVQILIENKNPEPDEGCSCD